MDFRDGLLVTRDGRRLGVVERGDTDAPPLVILHGMPGSRRMRPDAFRALEAHRRTITLDRPGYGRSDPHEIGDIQARVADIEDAAAALGLERFDLCGYSAGGFYGLAVAGALGRRVRSLVRIAPALPAELPEAEQTMLPALAALFQASRDDHAGLAASVRARCRSVLDVLAGGLADMAPVDSELLGRPETLAAIGVNAEAKGDVTGLLDDLRLLVHGLPCRLEDLRVPAVIWHGTADRNVPAESSRALADRLPGAILVEAPGGGHLLPWDPDHPLPTAILRLLGIQAAARSGR